MLKKVLKSRRRKKRQTDCCFYCPAFGIFGATKQSFRVGGPTLTNSIFLNLGEEFFDFLSLPYLKTESHTYNILLKNLFSRILQIW